jgi:dolichol-phosphate mannosyltransferase
MIYVCLPCHDEGPTVGLVLWRIRKVFEGLGREYQVLVVDDGSRDQTAEVLERYQEVVPLTVIRHPDRQGYARAVEALVRRALESSDRPRRDAAILMQADYSHRADYLTDAIRRLESGSDVVVGEAGLRHAPTRGYRLARRLGARWLRGVVAADGVRDPLSGFLGIRLSTLRAAFARGEPVLRCRDWAANAELLALAAPSARRIDAIAIEERQDLQARPSRVRPWAAARAWLGARGHIRRSRLARPVPPSPAAPEEGDTDRRGRGRSRGRRRRQGRRSG